MSFFVVSLFVFKSVHNQINSRFKSSYVHVLTMFFKNLGNSVQNVLKALLNSFYDRQYSNWVARASMGEMKFLDYNSI
ncbi:hypothetical protein SAMN04488009_2180 [Maribacter sedimenticola]|uniref:Uncharacterized protein n=1 Tax=Maribacter sedimenticola TaxID=228956 RepID=A0ABY1SHL4_9FLAO|nr:hypothetical protein SAMN04488009_2180 [Maribacter sedimenticola]